MRKDPTTSAQRDMLVLFTRKLTQQGHVSHEYDSVTPHPTMPMSVDLLIPARV
jgi:hypothetical protein